MRKTPAGAVCDDHPELEPMDERKAWEHLEEFHPDLAKWSRSVVESIAEANRPPAPRKRRQRRRKGGGKKHR